MIANGWITLGAQAGPGARLDAKLDAHGCPDLTLQLPLRTIVGKVVGAFQVSGWSWRYPDAEGGQVESHYSVGLLGPRGGRHGTSVLLDRVGMSVLSDSLRHVATHVDASERFGPLAIGLTDSETLFLNADRDPHGVLGGRLWTKGPRGACSMPLQPIHPEDLDQCSGLVRLVQEIIEP